MCRRGKKHLREARPIEDRSVHRRAASIAPRLPMSLLRASKSQLSPADRRAFCMERGSPREGAPHTYPRP
jgi:hypothetical protein